MATIFELAQMSADIYDGNSSVNQDTGPTSKLLTGLSGNWQVLATSNAGTTDWTDGYFAVAYYNSVTGEVVIANRGTDLSLISDPRTAFKNLFVSDAQLALGVPTQVQADAAAFSLAIQGKLANLEIEPTSIIETGHSLGGTEAQAGLVALVDDAHVANASAVLFNSPGVGGLDMQQAPSDYKAIDFYTQGDIVHAAGGVHLGAGGNLVNLATGPDPSVLATSAQEGGIDPAAGVSLDSLYDVFFHAHPISTILTYISRNGADSGLGATNWTSQSVASSITGDPIDISKPVFSVTAAGLPQVTDPKSGITTTYSMSSDGEMVFATFSGGTSPLARALSSLGTVAVPASEMGQSLTNISGASVISESLTRSENGQLHVALVNGDNLPYLFGDNFFAETQNTNGAFAYAVPSGTNTLIEYINNGKDNSNGSIVVVGASASTTLTGGAAVAGQLNTWEDDNGDLYTFTPTAGDSSIGTLTISQGLLANSSNNKIIVDNFNLQSARQAGGYLGIVLSEQLSLSASADAGDNATVPNFVAGASQSYTLSVDAPSTTAQTLTVSLLGVPIAGFEAVAGSTLIPLNADGTFNVTLAAGETNVSFSLANTSDVGASGSLQLSAVLSDPANPNGAPVVSNGLTQSFVEDSLDPFALPPTATLLSTGISVDGMIHYNDSPGFGESPAAVWGGPAEIFATQENEIIVGGAGADTIDADFGFLSDSAGVDQIVGNGGQDVILNVSDGEGGDGVSDDVQIFANQSENISSAIQSSQTAAQKSSPGDLIVNQFSSNATIVGSNGNDLITDTFGNALVIAGSGNDTIVGGLGAYDAPNGEPLLELGNNSFLANGWNVTSANTSGVTVSALQDGVSRPIFFAAPAFIAPPAGYEGNVDGNGFEYGSADETIYGGAGASTILLSNSDNYVDLGTGNSSVYGGMGENTIIGGSGQQFVQGGGGNDYITGGTGDSILMGRGGNNTIIGGGGNDMIYAGSSLTPAGPNTPAAEESGNNYVDGGSGNDQIYGSGGADTLIAGNGNSSVYGGAGSELIVGGSGNDLLLGGPGNDTIDAGGAGLDSIQALGNSSSTTVIYGGDGTDSINGGSGSNVIYAGDGGTASAPTTVFASLSDASATTTIYGGMGVDVLVGTAGTAVIYAGDGGTETAATSVFAGSGATTIYGGLGTDFLQGGSGTDVIYAGDSGTDEAPTTVVAGSGLATLNGGAGPSFLEDLLSGSDVLISSTADDTLIGSGADTLVAGNGNDILDDASGSATYVFNSGFGNDEIGASAGVGNIQFGAGIASTDLQVTAALSSGGTSELEIDGDGGSIDVVGGLAGAVSGVGFADSSALTISQLIAQDGIDSTVAGALGSMILSVENASAVAASGNPNSQLEMLGSDTISAWGNHDTLGAGSEGTLINAAGADDQVFAGAGNDTLVASGTADTLFGGAGNATFIVSNSSAVISVQPGRGIDTILASVNYTLPSNVEVLTLTGSANLSATGNADASNTLTGNAGADTLIAGSGADTLIAGAGVDTLVGGFGGDTFIVNNSADVVSTSAAHGADVIESSVNYTLPTNADILTLTGSANLIATGNHDSTNTITGNAGADTLQAGGGQDTLIGGTGIDTFIAGGGSDVFVINNSADVVQAGPGQSFDSIQASVSYALPANVDTLTLTGTANLTATGNSDATNIITSNLGNDSLAAGNGRDTLIALTGVDTLVAGSGSDVLQGSFGDTYVLNAGFGSTEIEQSGTGGTLEFGAGITAAGLTLSAQIGGDGTPALVLSSAGTGATTIEGAFAGSIAQFDFAAGSSLSLDQLLTTAQITPTTVAGANGNLILNGTAGASIVGGQGNDTLYGLGSNDTLRAGSGNDVIFAANTGALLIGGTGNDSLYGGAGNDTIVGGAGVSVMNGGSGDDTYVMTQGAVAQIQPASTAGRELLELPQGMSLADFVGYAVGQDLVIQSTTDNTSAVIQGYFNTPNKKTWFIASDTDPPQLLQNFVAALPTIADSNYTAEVAYLRQGFTANLSSELNSLGTAGGSLGTLQDVRDLGTVSSYTFNGTTTQNVTVTGGTLTVVASQSGQDQIQSQTTTHTVTTPVYTTEVIPGATIFYSLAQVAADLPIGSGGIPIGPPGSNVTQVLQQELVGGVEQEVLIGYNVQSAPTTRNVQTGTTSTQVTTSVNTDVSSRAFTNYNITGDGGNDSITASGPFVGTVTTGDGNVSVNLGTTSKNGFGDWISGNFPGTQTPLFSAPASINPYAVQPGAFIQAGAGNDTIVGTNGNDVIAAGLGYESLDGGNGADTYVVPMQGYATEIIADSGDPAPHMLDLLTGGTRTLLGGSGQTPADPERIFETPGPGQFPLDTLQLPAGITPQNLQYRLFTDPQDPSKQILELMSGTSTVDVVFAAPPTLPDLRVVYTDNIFQTLTTPASIGVDSFKFADGTTLTRDQLIAQATLLPNDFNPEVQAQSIAVHAGVSIAAAALFTSTDASDAPITWYRFSDAGGGGGHFVLNGQVEANNQPFLVNAGQLSQLSYVGGTVGSSDAIQVSVFDGAVWSAAATINVTPMVANFFQASTANQLVSGVSAGPDTLVGGFSNDTLAGGSGNDTFVFTPGVGALTISDAVSGNNTLAFSAGITSSMISLRIAADGALQLSVGSNGDVVNIEGFNAHDALNSGVVQNFSFGDGTSLTYAQLLSRGFDIVGTTGNQTLSGTNLNNRIVAGTGSDTLIGSGTNDTLTAGASADTMIGGSGIETFILNNSADLVQVSAGHASDTIESSASYALPSGVDSLILTGTANLNGSGNSDAVNTLVANVGADVLTAGSGNDSLIAGAGVDTLVAGAGNDTFIVNNTGDVVSVGTTHGSDTILSSVNYTLPTNVQTLVLTGTAALSATGNTLTDVLSANAGNDTLRAGSGHATLIGGAGNDLFVVNNVADLIQVGATHGADTIQSSVSYQLPTNVDTLTLTGAAALSATGNSDAANMLTGNSGADTLQAGSGADTLKAGTGVDTLLGGAGNDLFIVNNAADIVQVGSSHGADSVQASVSFTLPTNIDSLTLTGAAALSASGNSDAANLITGNSGADTLTAGSGADTLVAGTGVDLLIGGAGTDTFVVDKATDIVQVGAIHGNDSILSSVSYVLPANVDSLILTGTGNLAATGNADASNLLQANSGRDTLTSGTAIATLVGGAGSDTFVVNNAADTIEVGTTHGSDTVQSSVSFMLSANVDSLTLTGAGNISATGNNDATNTLTANSGADTLIAGSAITTLVGGTGNDSFVVNNLLDVVRVGATHGVDTIFSSVNYTLPTNVANLNLTGSANLTATGNTIADTITANSGNDTLTAGSGLATLVGGSGSDLFVVNNAADVIMAGASGGTDSIQSSVSYTLPTNVQYLTLTGTAARTATGNNLTDLIIGNTGNDTLVGGTGLAVLEAGTSGSQTLQAAGNQAALIGGGGADKLTGSAFNDFFAAGKISDTITTGATANVVSVNKGDGATTLQPTAGATNVLSLGAGIDTESLFFTKTGKNLILTDGTTGDSITFANWYAGAADQDYTKLQVVEAASANYNAAGSDALRNQALEEFNFSSLVAAYNAAGSPASWALSNAMPAARLAGSATADYGGDLAYYFGLNGNLTGIDLSTAQSTLTNPSFGTATQTIDAFAGVSGGNGLHLAVVGPQSISAPSSANTPATAITPKLGLELEPMEVDPHLSRVIAAPRLPRLRETSAPATATVEAPPMSEATSVSPSRTVAAGCSPELFDTAAPVDARVITPHSGIEIRAGRESTGAGATASLSIADVSSMISALDTRRPIGPDIFTSPSGVISGSFVNSINAAWLTVHGTLDQMEQVQTGASDTSNEHDELVSGAIAAASPVDRPRRSPSDHSGYASLIHQSIA